MRRAWRKSKGCAQFCRHRNNSFFKQGVSKAQEAALRHANTATHKQSEGCRGRACMKQSAIPNKAIRVAAAMAADIESLSTRNTANMRAVRRKYSLTLKDAPPEL